MSRIKTAVETAEKIIKAHELRLVRGVSRKSKMNVFEDKEGNRLFIADVKKIINATSSTPMHYTQINDIYYQICRDLRHCLEKKKEL